MGERPAALRTDVAGQSARRFLVHGRLLRFGSRSRDALTSGSGRPVRNWAARAVARCAPDDETGRRSDTADYGVHRLRDGQTGVFSESVLPAPAYAPCGG